MKISRQQISIFRNNILEFHKKDSISKPWNKDKDPYKIWLFEVVMQQTRMEQGLPYYNRLIRKFPTLKYLANAKEDDLFSVWKGLGYYSRARNLHFTANHIVKELKGQFPYNYVELIKLKGVGEYTAAAIASFAFDEDVAVLDGNVHRILSRIFGLNKTIQSSTDKKYFQSIASQLLIKGKSASFNQAMMDMGSQVCKPKNPKCDECVFSAECKAYLQNRILELPPPKVRSVIKDRYFYNLFVEYKGNVFIEKRISNDIWKGLYQGVVQEGSEIDDNFWKEKGIDISNIAWSDWQKQLLSHQRVWMKIGKLKVNKYKNFPMQQVQFAELENLALPRVVSRYFESTK